MKPERNLQIQNVQTKTIRIEGAASSCESWPQSISSGYGIHRLKIKGQGSVRWPYSIRSLIVIREKGLQRTAYLQNKRQAGR